MNTEQRLLCLAARTEITPDVEAQLLTVLRGPVDWEYLWTLVELHQVWPLVNMSLRRVQDRAAIPDGWSVRYHYAARGTFFDNALMAHQLLRLLECFEDAGVEALPVKGVALGEWLYGDPALRPAADLDVLLHHHDLPAARAALQKLGFQPEANPDFGHVHHAFHEPPYSMPVGGRDVQVELHWSLWAAHLFRIPMSRLWDRAVMGTLRGRSVRLLAPEDALLHLAIHRSRSAPRLRLLCDIAELLHRFGATLDWDYVVEMAHQGGARSAMNNALGMAHDLLGAPLTLGILGRFGISWEKQRALEAFWGPEALVRPASLQGTLAELTLGQRLVMLDGSRQVIWGLRHHVVRGIKRVANRVPWSYEDRKRIRR